MTAFRYRALDAAGKEAAGVIEVGGNGLDPVEGMEIGQGSCLRKC